MTASDGVRLPTTLLIACGALAKEIVEIIDANGWHHVRVQCLPAELHNRPERIPDAVRGKIHDARGHFDHVFVAYADCGTGGLLDAVLEQEGVERLPGAHCYEFFAGSEAFRELSESEPGTFYLTDFLTRHFRRLVIEALGLDRHPELADEYFGNYRKLVYLAQGTDPGLEARAREAATFLGLEFEMRETGYGDLERSLVNFAGRQVEVAAPGAGRN
ncbi:MAG: DUF1638 domain-containing protein [Gammaproteobacteria bacterium]|nr:DUF1638 domain-containing protein [Gammaproteobacteria bacterium]